MFIHSQDTNISYLIQLHKTSLAGNKQQLYYTICLVHFDFGCERFKLWRHTRKIRIKYENWVLEIPNNFCYFRACMKWNQYLHNILFLICNIFQRMTQKWNGRKLIKSKFDCLWLAWLNYEERVHLKWNVMVAILKAKEAQQEECISLVLLSAHITCTRKW